MVKVSVLYPTKPGYRFDGEYYLNIHMPMAIESLGAALKGVSMEIGIGGGAPGEPPPFAAMCHFICEGTEAFTNAFLPHAEKLQGDIINYTDIAPVIQIGEIKISR
jgi:uncharacterized protein (TIGR02118 family)